jgi:uncharacterized protein (DUF1800 family)
MAVRRMTIGMDTRTAQALIRFGLGRRGEEALPADPAAWLLGQLAGPDPGLTPAPATTSGLAALREDRQSRPEPGQSRSRAVYRAETAALAAHALVTTTPFRERLVWFWANHFTVSLRQPACAAVAGAFVQQAIRPHVTARFADMLLAVMRHPAMLLYLNNAQSIGPNSPAGLRTQRGLNENLARECLELHTVGAEAGYTQADVTAFAAILTGWSIALDSAETGFRFRPNAHEPGAKTLMGRTFPPGETGGVEALGFLAAHPSTHRLLADKLARHFVADDPPADLVRRLEAALRDTGGDLGAASRTLVGIEAAWQPLGKLRSPIDYAVAALRAVDLSPERQPDLLVTATRLGQPWFAAPLPNGWPDRSPDWAPGLLRRVDWAHGLAGQASEADGFRIAEASLGPLLTPATSTAMRRAGSRQDALTLLLASPEFQRR